jgi:cyclic-di-GMP-binding protein
MRARIRACCFYGPTMPTFDIVSELDKHEVLNAIDQANRELVNRFDFRGTGCVFELDEFVVTMKAQSDFQLKQMLDILKPRLVARGVDIRCMEIADAETNLAAARQKVTLKQGIDQKNAKDIIRQLKDAKIKVEAQINAEKVRVSGKKRDDLQNAIALLRKLELDLPLQFENFRD